MLELIINTFGNNTDRLLAVSLLIISSLYIIFLFEIFGQKWVRTKAHTATLMLLPLIVYVITNVISGNIALSLGMVGALSIVRFRNPVRSPLELAAYFCTITLGIAAAVSIKWVLFLISSITLGLIVLVIVNFIYYKIFGYTYFTTSFSEGNSLSTLSVSSTNTIDILDNNVNLVSKTKSNNIINYTLAMNDFFELKKISSHPEVKIGSSFIELKK